MVLDKLLFFWRNCDGYGIWRLTGIAERALSGKPGTTDSSEVRGLRQSGWQGCMLEGHMSCEPHLWEAPAVGRTPLLAVKGKRGFLLGNYWDFSPLLLNEGSPAEPQKVMVRFPGMVVLTHVLQFTYLRKMFRVAESYL